MIIMTYYDGARKFDNCYKGPTKYFAPGPPPT